MKLLYIEDDPAARQYVETALRRKGFSIDLAASAAEGLERALEGAYDALIIDVMLPDGEGFDLLQRLRASGVQTPALFLSSRGRVEDRLRGFETGADDYLPKPFALSELVARTRAIARRAGPQPQGARLRVADLELDVAERRAYRGGRAIDLPPKQCALLELLMRNAGRVLTRDQIVDAVWGYGKELRSNAVAVQVNYLRKSVDEGFESRLIHTRQGLGYVLEERPPSPGPAGRGARDA